MSRRRAWLTPDTPPPEEERGRCFSVPDDSILVGAVTGALLPLTQEENWEAQGSMTPAEAAQIMSASFEAFVNGDCSGTAECPPIQLPDETRIYRQNPETGAFEYVNPETGEWIVPEGDEAIPAPPAREEEEDEDKLCAAATNAVNVIHVLLDETIALWEQDVEPTVAMAELATTTGLTLGSYFYPPIAGMLAAVEFGFSTFYSMMEAITVNMWDETFDDLLTCIFLEHATLQEDGSVTFDFQAVNRDILSSLWHKQTYVVLVGQILFLTFMIGPQGMNQAGSTTAVQGDCNQCGTWEMDWSYTNGLLDNGDWTLEEGVWKADGSAGWVYYSPPFDGAYRRIKLTKTIDTTNCVITYVGAQMYAPSGGTGDKYHYREVTNSQGLTLSGYNFFPYESGVNWFDSGSDQTDMTTGTETTITLRMTANNSQDWRFRRILLRGTGRNPFA